MPSYILKNKLTYIIICLLFACINTLLAQNTDSLLILLKTDKEDTNKVIHLYTICKKYNLLSEYDKGLICGKQALALAKALDFKKGEATAYNNIGNIHTNQGNYPEALKMFFASLKIYEETDSKKGIANSYNGLGIIYKCQGN